jgi:DNA-directed RNA polymerase III subunit RPC1
MCWTLRIHQAHATCVSYWILQANDQHAVLYLQGQLSSPTQSRQLTVQSCARCLLLPTERAGFLKRFRRPGLEGLQRNHLAKSVLSSCKKRNTCPWCEAPNGIVKRSGTMKISHEPYRASKNATAKEEYLQGFGTAVAENKALGMHLSKAVEDMNPLKVLELFKRVSAEDAELLSLHPDIGRPEDYIWQYISVPPPCIRPSVASEAGK